MLLKKFSSIIFDFVLDKIYLPTNVLESLLCNSKNKFQVQTLPNFSFEFRANIGYRADFAHAYRYGQKVWSKGLKHPIESSKWWHADWFFSSNFLQQIKSWSWESNLLAVKSCSCEINQEAAHSTCGNFWIFLSLRFYVKSIVENLKVLKLTVFEIVGTLDFKKCRNS